MSVKLEVDLGSGYEVIDLAGGLTVPYSAFPVEGVVDLPARLSSATPGQWRPGPTTIKCPDTDTAINHPELDVVVLGADVELSGGIGDGTTGLESSGSSVSRTLVSDYVPDTYQLYVVQTFPGFDGVLKSLEYYMVDHPRSPGGDPLVLTRRRLAIGEYVGGAFTSLLGWGSWDGVTLDSLDLSPGLHRLSVVGPGPGYAPGGITLESTKTYAFGFDLGDNTDFRLYPHVVNGGFAGGELRTDVGSGEQSGDDLWFRMNNYDYLTFDIRMQRPMDGSQIIRPAAFGLPVEGFVAY